MPNDTTSPMQALRDLAEQTTEVYDEFILELNHVSGTGTAMTFGAKLAHRARETESIYRQSIPTHTARVQSRAIQYLTSVTALAGHMWFVMGIVDHTAHIDQSRKD